MSTECLKLQNNQRSPNELSNKSFEVNMQEYDSDVVPKEKPYLNKN